MEGVWALSSVGLLPRAAELKATDHCLLGVAWDELRVNRSGGVRLRSFARHDVEGRRSPDMSLWVDMSVLEGSGVE